MCHIFLVYDLAGTDDFNLLVDELTLHQTYLRSTAFHTLCA